MFYESNCHPWKATCFCWSTYCIYIDILLLKTKYVNRKIYISLEQLKMINMQRKSAIESYAFLSKYGFHHHHCQSKSQYFLILTTCFFRGIITTSNEFTIAPENSSKIGRPPYGVRLITYNAVRCPAGHRLMFSYTDAGRRPYDLWLRKRKFLKIVHCPGDYQIRRCKSVKSYIVSFICDHSISVAYFCFYYANFIYIKVNFNGIVITKFSLTLTIKRRLHGDECILSLPLYWTRYYTTPHDIE